MTTLAIASSLILVALNLCLGTDSRPYLRRHRYCYWSAAYAFWAKRSRQLNAVVMLSGENKMLDIDKALDFLVTENMVQEVESSQP